MDYDSSRGGADIIVPVRNQFHRTRSLLEDLYRYSDLPFRIYVIDNASTDQTVDLSKIYTRDIKVARNREDLGWASGINQGIRLGSNPYLVFMTNKVEVSQGWLGNLITFLDTHPKIAAVCPLSSNSQDLQSVDLIRDKMVPQIPHFLTADLHERNRILRYHFHRAGILVEGTLDLHCVALKRRVVEAVGDLDEGEHGEGSDGEYSRRLRKAGYVLGLALDTYVIHNTNEAVQDGLRELQRKEARRAGAIR